MKIKYSLFKILAIALPSLRIFLCTWLIAMGILAIVLLYTAAIAFYAVYIQSIGSGKGIFSELFILALIPVKPDEDPSQGGPSNRLTKQEKAALTLSPELKQILVGLTLGDVNIQKLKKKCKCSIIVWARYCS